MSQKKIDKQMKQIEDKRAKGRIFKKDSSFLKAEENVFDVPTLKLLYSFANKGIISELGGSISTGKEANVFYATGNEGEVAVKIYRINSSTFKAMDPYILKDPRFTHIRHSRKDIIFAWTQKEYQNLLRINKAGIRAPRPVTFDRNILVMEFMGENGIAYPSLKDVKMDDEDARLFYDQIIENMRRMYVRASLVHADLSEYNILIDIENEEAVIIDVGQAVTLNHPNAREFLTRDIENIKRFFKKYGIDEGTKEIAERIKQKKEEDTIIEPDPEEDAVDAGNNEKTNEKETKEE
ncbi:serine protein kinase RIO [Methanimicrococcus blatticola]|uniref:non-specific serine/threonine protein kinase n=1 Tax=Methanimicrococcus blatticola TaxID=91560 RepID=A0A484F521_9EURY|nr:serine protein kinase RIO [Methanimicrococcus blatticola]MBZ3935879.1 serine protein kinase RIO [Methanimicrococcus blatticola]MCC2508000.1 serine protein kinase RIO [Methanimicrococcus blatticola]TDQ68916.1 serine/threonine protein kinase [Methanimicrococcus blatticola]